MKLKMGLHRSPHAFQLQCVGPPDVGGTPWRREPWALPPGRSCWKSSLSSEARVQGGFLCLVFKYEQAAQGSVTSEERGPTIKKKRNMRQWKTQGESQENLKVEQRQK